MAVIFYDSVQEFEKALPATGNPGSEKEKSWAGGYSYKEARKALFQGHAESLKRAEKLMSKLEADGLALTQSHWERRLVGFIPCIPSFISGAPDCMYMQCDKPSDAAPIRVFTCLSVSAELEADEVMARGCAILALCRKLQAIRPVELYVYGFHNGNAANNYTAIPVIKLETNPLDLTIASYVLGHTSMVRQLTMAWAHQRGYDGSFAFVNDIDLVRTRRILGASETDLVIGIGHISDKSIKNPVAWVNEQVARYADMLEDAS